MGGVIKEDPEQLRKLQEFKTWLDDSKSFQTTDFRVITEPKYPGATWTETKYIFTIKYKNEKYFVIFTETETNLYMAIQTARFRDIWHDRIYTNGHIGLCDKIIEHIEDDRKQILKKKQLKENPDTLNVIKFFLKEQGYKVSRYTYRDYNNSEVPYLIVSPTIMPFFILIVDGNVVFRLQNHRNPDHIIPTDLADPKGKTLDHLLTLIKYFSSNWETLLSELNVSYNQK
jgi:hypothetical protein